MYLLLNSREKLFILIFSAWWIVLSSNLIESDNKFTQAYRRKFGNPSLENKHANNNNKMLNLWKQFLKNRTHFTHYQRIDESYNVQKKINATLAY